MRIWDFTSYRPYLIARAGGARSGWRARLAQALPVHTTFISQVLGGKADFSPEQGESVNAFLEHTEDEGEYFLLLLMKDRAGTRALKSRFEKRIRALREDRLNVGKRIGATAEISERDRARFYSNHLYGAIHVLASLPEMKMVDDLARALKLPKPRVQEIVDFCLRLGVLNFDGGRLAPGSRHIHLGAADELVLRHHKNWREHAIQRLAFADAEDLHYSACLSLSQADAFRVKDLILECLKANVDIVGQSRDEVAFVLNFDFYKLIE